MVRSALADAASVASLMTTTECVVWSLDQKTGAYQLLRTRWSATQLQNIHPESWFACFLTCFIEVTEIPEEKSSGAGGMGGKLASLSW